MTDINDANKLFDLIFMDINLPDTNGIALTIHLRRPIIALTSEESVIRPMCFMTGMNDFVRKPVSYKILKNILLEWLEWLE